MKWAINRKVENERAGFDLIDCNLAGSNPQDLEWPTAEESVQPNIDIDFAGKGNGDGKGKENGKGMQASGKGEMNPLQIMVAFNNTTSTTREDPKEEGKEEKGAAIVLEIIWSKTARNRRRRRGNATSAAALAAWPKITGSPYKESRSMKERKQLCGRA